MKAFIITLFLLGTTGLCLAQIKGYAKVYETRVYFASAKYDLNSDATDSLDKLVAYLAKDQSLKVYITAHTDSIGSITRNKILSENRAKAVEDYLISHNINPKSIAQAAFGKLKPVADNSQENTRWQNRRCVVEVFKSTAPKPTMITISGKLRDKTTGQGISGEVFLRSKNYIDSTTTDKDGNYKIPAPVNTNVTLEYFAPGHFFENQSITTSQSEMVVKEVLIPQARKGSKLPLFKINFIGNSPQWLPEAEAEMNRLLRFLLKNPKVKIEIEGHVNDPGETKAPMLLFDKNLSISRAESVKKYLVENGVKENRLTTTGKGNMMMLFPNPKNENEQMKNRRVEIMIWDE